MTSREGILPGVCDGSGYMVGDRSHFHFLQLHHWTAVLNCTHNYHIAGDEQLSNNYGWILMIKIIRTYMWRSLTGSSQFWLFSPHLRSTTSAFGTPTTFKHFRISYNKKVSLHWLMSLLTKNPIQQCNPTLILLHVFSMISSASCPLDPSTTMLKNLVTRASRNMEQLASFNAALIGTFT